MFTSDKKNPTILTKFAHTKCKYVKTPTGHEVYMTVLSKIPPRTELKINLYNVQNDKEYVPNREYDVDVEVVDYLTR